MSTSHYQGVPLAKLHLEEELLMLAVTLFSLEDRDSTKISTMKLFHRELNKLVPIRMDLLRKSWREQIAREMEQLPSQDSQTARRPWPLDSLANISMTRKLSHLINWVAAFLMLIWPNQIRKLDCILKKELLMLEIQDMPPPRLAPCWEVLLLGSMCCMREKYQLIMPRKFNPLHLILTISAKTPSLNSIQSIIRIQRLYSNNCSTMVRARKSSASQMKCSMTKTMNTRYLPIWKM